MTTAGQAGLQELDLDVEKTGVLQNQDQEHEDRNWNNDKSRLHTDVHTQAK